AEHVDSKRATEPDAQGVTGSPLPALLAPTYPLSFQQRQLLFLDDLAQGDAPYNAPLGFRVSGPIDRDALTKSIEMLIDRHEALRTVLRPDAVDGEQIVLAPPRIQVPDVDVSPVDDIDEILREHARRPFDLGT